MRIVETAEAVTQGKRPEMQDFVVQAPITHGARYFGVFDGHGNDGEYVAELARDVLLEVAAEQDDLASARAGAVNVRAALRTLHGRLRWDSKAQQSGTTATVAVFKDDLLSVPQIGDGGALYVPDIGHPQILTKPHTPDNEQEVERVRKLDPPVFVETVRERLRFDGSYMISRAIGDHAERYMIGTADISTHAITHAGTLVLGSDGLLGDCVEKYQRVVSEIGIKQHLGLDELAMSLVSNFALVNRDNASVILARVA